MLPQFLRSFAPSARNSKRKPKARRIFTLERLEERSLLTAVPTLTALTTSASTVAFGQSVTLTATVTVAAPHIGTPSGGTVTFLNGSTALGTATLNSGTATIQVSALPAGTDLLMANYGGNSSFAHSGTVIGPNAVITCVAGNGAQGYSGDSGPATDAELNYPQSVAVDSAGDLFIVDTWNNAVREVNHTSGLITTVAGNGYGSYFGDNGPATDAELDNPTGVAVDSAGDLFIADTYNNRVREVNHATGRITTVAGNAYEGYFGDNGPATDAELSNPSGVALDANGDLFIADSSNNAVREVNHTTGTITTVAGNGYGGYFGDNGPATDANLNYPTAVAVDSGGDLFIADSNNAAVREVNHASGAITTVAGNGYGGYFGDNGPATDAELSNPSNIAVDSAGDLFIADTYNNRVRGVNSSTGLITTLAGDGYNNYFGDNGPVTAAELSNLSGVALDSAGNLYIADSSNDRIREVVNGVPVTVTVPSPTTTIVSGDQPLSSAYGQTLTFSATVSATSGGAAPTGSVQFVVNAVDFGAPVPLSGGTASMAVTTFSPGTYQIDAIYTGNNPDSFQNSRTAASLTQVVTPAPLTITADNQTMAYGGPLPKLTARYSGFVNGETSANLTTLPTVTTTATSASPLGSYVINVSGAVDANYSIRYATGLLTVAAVPTLTSMRVSATTEAIGQTVTLTATVTAAAPNIGPPSGGIVTFFNAGTIVGTATLKSGTVAIQVTTLPVGTDLLTASYSGCGIFAGSSNTIAPSSIITTVAGNGTQGYRGDNGSATAAELNYPESVAVDSAGDLFIVDKYNNVVREVNSITGAITTVAGNSYGGYFGDNGPASAAELSNPSGVAWDSAGDLFIADSGNNVVREVNHISGTITTVAGNGYGGYFGDNGPATAAELFDPRAVVVDSAGDLFIADSTNQRIREVNYTTGTITTVAGNGYGSYFGDNGPATAAELFYPMGIALDSAGDLFIADSNNRVVREVNFSTGVITTVAGDLGWGSGGDNGPATAAELNYPESVAVDSAGDLFIVDKYNNVVREVNSITGAITTLAGNGYGSYFGDNGPTTAARLSNPTGIAMDAAGDLFIADSGNNRIREISNGVAVTVLAELPTLTSLETSAATVTIGQSLTLTATVTAAIPVGETPSGGVVEFFSGSTLLGTATLTSGTAILTVTTLPLGTDTLTASYSGSGIFVGSSTVAEPNPIITTVAGHGNTTYNGDGIPATAAQLGYPKNVAMDSAGDLFIADTGNSRIREVNYATGAITTVAGNGTQGYSGDNGPATNAELNYPQAVAVDSAGDLFIADSNNEAIREVNHTTGLISTVVGNGSWGFGGDNGPASAAQLNNPAGVAVDTAGDLFIADSNNQRIREVNHATGLITTVAGNSYGGYFGDNGPATAAELSNPSGIAVDSAGDLFIADTYNQRIREVNYTTGLITTVAGNGGWGYNGDNGPATAAGVFYPEAVALDSTGDLFIADSNDRRIREVNLSSDLITTVAGDGIAGNNGDNGPATAAQLANPSGIAVDSAGDLFIADSGNNRVREVNHAGLITNVAGVANLGDGGPATAAQLGYPRGVAMDSAGDLFFADSSNDRIREVNHATGLITTVAGNGIAGYSGDNGLATAAELANPAGVAVDAAGNLFIADSNNQRIREVNHATGLITTVAGNGTVSGMGMGGYSGDNGPATAAQLDYPSGIAVDAAGDLFIADSGNDVVREVHHATGLITTVAGNGIWGSGGENIPATATELAYPQAVAVDTAGDLFIADENNNRIREVNHATGLITTVAGNGYGSYVGDNGPATAAKLNQPAGVALDAAGDIFIADSNNNRIREVVTGLTVVTVGLPTVSSVTPMGGPMAGSSTVIIMGTGFTNATQVDFGTLAASSFTVDSDNQITATSPAGSGVVDVTVVTPDATTATSPTDQFTYMAAPAVTSVTPSGGPLVGGTTVMITGSGFTNATQVDFGTLAASSFTVNSDTQITATSPVETAGTVYVTVTTPGGTSTTTSADQFDYVIAPVVTGVSPAAGLIAGGTTVTITGMGFTGATAVDFGAVVAGSFTINSDTQITVTSPAGAAGAVYVTVTTLGGTSANLSADQFTYLTAFPTLTSLQVSAVTVTIGQPITLTATVTAAIPNTGTPTGGTVTFLDGSTSLGTATLRSGTATLTVTTLPVGTDTLTAVYSGSNLYTGSSTVSGPIPVITTIAGNGTTTYAGDGLPATAAELTYPRGVAVDSAGDLFIADSDNQRIREVNYATGAITTVAGTGSEGYGGDNGPATAAELSYPEAVAVDSAGDLFIADSDNQRIREVNHTTGIITTVAGNGSWGFSGDNGPATTAELCNPAGVAVDSAGDLFIADSYNQRIREVNHVSGVITTVAGSGFTFGMGSGGFAGDNGPATAAELSNPMGVAVDSAGNLFIADSNNQRVREVNYASGLITTVAGNGNYGYYGDNGPATAAALYYPQAVTLDSAGDLFIADPYEARIHEVNFSTTLITTVAGNGNPGYTGDNGLASVAELYQPAGVAVDTAGDLFIADSGNNVVREVNHVTSLITTVAGGGDPGDGGPATAAVVADPRSVALDSAGDLFIADTNNNRIREVNRTTGLITTVAGNGIAGYGGNGGAATAAELNYPRSVAVDTAGDLFIAEADDRIREVHFATGLITTVAGNGMSGYSGDNGPATAAELNQPSGVALDSAGDLFFADSNNNVVREMNRATGLITTVAGNGIGGYSGDSGPATTAELNQPSCVVIDSAGDLFIVDSGNNVVREVNHTTGLITTVAGNGTWGYGGENIPATAVGLVYPQAVAVDAAGDLFIADTNTSRIREVNYTTGLITTVAGNWGPGYGGDNGPATAAELNQPAGVALDAAGDLFIADSSNNRIREVVTGLTVVTVELPTVSSVTPTGGPMVGSTTVIIIGTGFTGATQVDFGTLAASSFTVDSDNQITATSPAGSGVVDVTVVTPGATTAISPADQFTYLAAPTVTSVTPSGGPMAGGTTVTITGAGFASATQVDFGALAASSFTVNSDNQITATSPAGTGVVDITVVALGGTSATTSADQFDYAIPPVVGGVSPAVGLIGDGTTVIITGIGFTGATAVDFGTVAAGSFTVNSDTQITATSPMESAGAVYVTVTTLGGTSANSSADQFTYLTAFPTATSVQVSASIAALGLPVTLTATVTSAFPIAGTPSEGTVAFFDGSTLLGTETLHSGAATFTVITLPAGADVLTASYSGGGSFAGSSSGIGANSVITTVAGNGTTNYSGDGIPATAAVLWNPSGVAVDSAGDLFIADQYNSRIREVNHATGVITTVAGDGKWGYWGNNGQATAAELSNPTGLALDSAGNLFIADSSNQVIREVNHVTGVITTVAGNQTQGYGGDNGPSTAAELNNPEAVAVDSVGDLFIADSGNNVVREVNHATGLITTIAGNGTPGYSGDNALATDAELAGPSGVAVDAAGDLFIADAGNNVVREVNRATGLITTVAGGGSQQPGDNGQATDAALWSVSGVAVDSAGDLFITGNDGIREVNLAMGLISTVAGGGDQGLGDHGQATTAELNGPSGVAVDSAGDVFVADSQNNRIRKVNHAGLITTVAGGGIGGDNGPATAAELNGLSGVAVDTAGDVFIADSGNNVVREVNCVTGLITTIAGNGTYGYGGDNGPATAAELWAPSGVAMDSAGDLFIADSGNNVVREVNLSTGLITTFAGGGEQGLGDNGPATAAELSNPSGIAVDAAGDLFIADTGNGVVREVNCTTRLLSIVAGTGSWGGYFGDNGPATAAGLLYPKGVAVDSAGDLFIADPWSNVVREVNYATGVITTVAGDGGWGYVGDNGPAIAAELAGPSGVAVDAAGDLFIADAGNNVVREVSHATGLITTVAGNGKTWGYVGDNGPASAAELSPAGVAVDSAGDLFIADSSNARIREVANGVPVTILAVVPTLTALQVSATSVKNGQPVTLTATVTDAILVDDPPTGGVVKFFNGSTFLGTATLNSGTAELQVTTLPVGTDVLTASYTGSGVFAASSSTAIGPNSIITTVVGGGTTPSDDGLPATAAALGLPQGVATDSAGDLFIADSGNNVVREVHHATGLITTVAGNGAQGYSGDNGPATAAELNGPTDVALDSAGDLFIADYNNGRIREVNFTTGIITTVAGNGNLGGGDDGPATAVGLMFPKCIALDTAGDIFIAENIGNSAVREVNHATGMMTTVAGNGAQGDSGDNGPATAAELNAPAGLAVDSVGDLFIADSNDNRIREVNSATGLITTVAGNGTQGYGGDNGPATAAELWDPAGIAVDAAGDLFIADYNNARIREVDLSTDVITTFAGGGGLGLGDNAPATAAKLYYPSAVTLDTAGNLFIADYGNDRIREVNHASGAITTVAGNGTGGFAGDNGLATAAELAIPAGVAVDSAGDLFIADLGDNRVREVNHATGAVTTVAGGGSHGLGDNGPATAAELEGPFSVAVDSDGDLFIADSGDNRIREVNHATGAITTVAGDGTNGKSGDNGPATAAELSAPWGIAVDTAGNLFIADTGNNVVREVNRATGAISTVAGNGARGYSGDGSQATAAEVGSPFGVAVDTAGNLFFTDTNDGVIREVNLSTGLITTVAGNGTSHNGDNGLATAAALESPLGVAVDAAGDLFIADADARIREVVLSTGLITTVAGNGTMAYSGDNGLATAAELSLSFGVAVDAAGNLFIADTQNNRIREVANGAAVTVLGSAIPTVIGVSPTSGPTAGGTTVTITGTGFADATLVEFGTVAVSTFTVNSDTQITVTSPAGTGVVDVAVVTASGTSVTSSVDQFTYNAPVTPTITWSKPADIIYGTALGNTQLDATASVPGTFVYTPRTGTVLHAGVEVLSVTFTPTDTIDYTTATITVSINVAQVIPVITWATPTAIVYGTALSGTQLNASASVAGTCSYSVASGTVLNAGVQALSLTFTPSDTIDYTTTSAHVNLTVTPARLTVTANDASKNYGSADPAFSVSDTGFVVGEGPSNLAGTLGFGTNEPSTGYARPGTYQIIPSGLRSSNYSITFVPGTLTVNTATITVEDFQTISTYNVVGATQATASTSTLAKHDGSTGLLSTSGNDWMYRSDLAVQQGDTISVWMDFPILADGRAYFTFGSSSTGTLSLVAAPNTNQFILQNNSGWGFVNLAATPQTWLTNHWYHLEVDWGATGNIVGKLFDSDGSTLLNSVTSSTTVITAGGIGFRSLSGDVYWDTVQFTPAANQSSVAGGAAACAALGRATVVASGSTPQQITQTIAYGPIGDHCYGDTIALAAAASSGLPVSFAVISGPATITGNILKVIGLGTVTVEAVQPGNANYLAAESYLSFKATPAPLTITAKAQSSIYGSALPALRASYAGFVNGDTPASLAMLPALTTAATATSDVGSYAIAVSRAADVDYTITYVPGTLTITPAPLTITADDQSSVYGSTLPVLTASYAGFLNGDTPASLGALPTLSTAATAASGVGSYAIMASGAADVDYTINYVPGTLTITPVPLTITADDQSSISTGRRCRPWRPATQDSSTVIPRPVWLCCQPLPQQPRQPATWAVTQSRSAGRPMWITRSPTSPARLPSLRRH